MAYITSADADEFNPDDNIVGVIERRDGLVSVFSLAGTVEEY